MSKVIEALKNSQNALLESPTGTGKTLCLLCATLAWREHLKIEAEALVETVKLEKHESETVQAFREANALENWHRMKNHGEGLPTIIYSSRTHSQLQQVMKELKTTGYKHTKTAVLFSRQHGCLNPTVKDVPGTAGNRLCRNTVAKGGCKWWFGVEKFAKANPTATSDILDIEDLQDIGLKRTVCPYYLSRTLAGDADLIFMPYNYLMDGKFRGGLPIKWENSVLIFDEAHNLEGVCSDAVSFDLPLAVISGSIEEAGTAAELFLQQSEATTQKYVLNDKGTSNKDNVDVLKEQSNQLRQLQFVLKKFEQELTSMVVSQDKGVTKPGAFLFELLAAFGLTSESWGIFSWVMSSAVDALTADAAIAGKQNAARNTSYRLHALREALQLAFDTLVPLKDQPSNVPRHIGYRVHVHLEKAKNGQMLPTLSYWCFSPGQSMLALTEHKVRRLFVLFGCLLFF